MTVQLLGVHVDKFPDQPNNLWIDSKWANYQLIFQCVPCIYQLVLGYRHIRLSMWFIAFCAGSYLITVFQYTSQLFDNPVDWLCFIIATGTGQLFAILAANCEFFAFVCCGISIGRTLVGFLLLLCYALGNYVGYDYFEGYFILANMLAFMCLSLWFRSNEYYHSILLATTLGGIFMRSITYLIFLIPCQWNDKFVRVLYAILVLMYPIIVGFSIWCLPKFGPPINGYESYNPYLTRFKGGQFTREYTDNRMTEMSV